MPTRAPPRRSEYARFERATTRWMDNDVYGHVNNAHAYAYFDSAINRVLVEAGLDIHRGEVAGFVVSSSCDYFRPFSYPDAIEIAVRVDRLGNSSATYGLAIFLEGDDEARAAGSMTHVFVHRPTSRPVPIPPALRGALEALLRPD
jgi:acyl-CoA thioester hydrolase